VFSISNCCVGTNGVTDVKNEAKGNVPLGAKVTT